MSNVISDTKTEIQTGLWLRTYVKVISGNQYTFRELYSDDGYCFYDKTMPVYREDENGNLYLVPEDQILPEERLYSRYASLGMLTDVNNFVSVPIDPAYEIVNQPPQHEVA